MDKDTGSSVMLAVTQSIGMFTTFLPPLAEIRKSHDDPEMINDVRLGEVAACALVLGIGAIATSITDSSVPIAASAICALLLVVMYESILKNPPREKVVK